MSARAWFVSATLACTTACLPSIVLPGPYACSDGTCPTGYACDENLCCIPGSTPTCPTLSFNGQCADGGRDFLVYEDLDGDGFGNLSVSRGVCARPSAKKWVLASGDCDDSRADVRPDALDVCDGFDNNCNGDFDEDSAMRTQFYPDVDGDGFGSNAGQLPSCKPPPGTVDAGGDCDDSKPSISPAAVERCNGIDDNCDQVIDNPPLVDALPIGSTTNAFSCTSSALGICKAGRLFCVNGAPTCTPGLTPRQEVCNFLDDNCDGRVDEQPDCGGPDKLFGPNVKVTVKRYTGTGVSVFQSTCPADIMAVNEPGFSTVLRSGTFAFTGASAPYIFVFEPADGGTWDLTGAHIGLKADFTTRWTGAHGPRGAWGDGVFDTRSPVVTLCGAGPNDIVRFVTKPDAGLRFDAGSWDTVLPMTSGGRDGEWLFGVSSGFDVAKTQQVTMVLVPYVSNGTVTFGFGAATGFVRDAGL